MGRKNKSKSKAIKNTEKEENTQTSAATTDEEVEEILVKETTTLEEQETTVEENEEVVAEVKPTTNEEAEIKAADEVVATEEPKTEETTPVAVQEESTPVVEATTPAVEEKVEETKPEEPKVVEEPTPAVVEEPKTEETTPIVVEEPKIVEEPVVETTTPVAVEEPVAAVVVEESNQEQFCDFDDYMKNQAKLLLSLVEVEKNYDAFREYRNEIVHEKLEKDGTLEQLLHTNSDAGLYFQEIYNQITIQNREQLPFLIYERFLSLAREAYYKSEKEFLIQIDEGYETMTNVKDKQYSYTFFEGAKLVNQFRNFFAPKKQGAEYVKDINHRDFIRVVNDIQYNDIDTKFSSEKDKLFKRCLDTIKKEFPRFTLPELEENCLKKRMVGLNNYGGFLHIASTSTFKIRENRTLEEKIENLQKFMQVYPHLVKKCKKLIKKRYGELKQCPDIGKLLEWAYRRWKQFLKEDQ